MTLRRSLQFAAATAAFVTPLAAFAATVTTGPLGASAPALGMPVLVVLAMALIGLGAYSIRNRSTGAVTGFVLVAGLSLLVGLGYAATGVKIVGTDCNKVSTHTYFPETATLTSECPNPIQIIAIDCLGTGDMGGSGGDVLTLPSCFVGDQLNNGDVCRLPICI